MTLEELAYNTKLENYIVFKPKIQMLDNIAFKTILKNNRFSSFRPSFLKYPKLF